MKGPLLGWIFAMTLGFVLKVLIVCQILTVIYSFNFYKLGHIQRLIDEHGVWAQEFHRIFLWMDPGQKSGSPLIWLLFHISLAVSHLTLSGLLVIWGKKTEWIPIHDTLHWIFCLTTIANLYHSGEAVWWLAILEHSVSIVPLIIAHELERLQKVFGFSDWYLEWSPWIYFLALASSPSLEVILYMLR